MKEKSFIIFTLYNVLSVRLISAKKILFSHLLQEYMTTEKKATVE